ncbi:MAG TPA: exodeoxyribonuclease III [Nitrospiria bacterium]|jgi:exodeoxyribonuclease-3
MAFLKIGTWNVNSIRTRLQAVLQWLKEQDPHVLCLQETKVQDEQFPKSPIEEAGFHVAFNGQKAYNGVAIISKLSLRDVSMDFDGNPNPLQKRFIGATVGSVRVINVYIPNGSEVGSPAFQFKLDFFGKLSGYIKKIYTLENPLVLVGDFNVAPEAIDVYDPVAMEGQILFHPDERRALGEFGKWGLVDLFRHFHSKGNAFTWWDYRMNAFRRKMGLRIDHIFATPYLAQRCRECEIDSEPRKKEKPSDHAPVIATFEI